MKLERNKLNQYSEIYYKEAAYSLDNWIILNDYAQRIIELIGEDAKEKSLLECGIGHGYTVNIFNQFFDNHVVLDADSDIINNFKQNNPDCHAEIIQTYFEDYTPSRQFDFIILGFVLEHVENPLQLIVKYKNYLKDHGKMYIAVPNAESLNRRIGYEAGLLPDIYDLSENDRQLGHRRYYTVKAIHEICIQAGLQIKRTEGIFLKAVTSAQLSSLELSDEIYQAFCRVGRDYPELSLGILVELEKPAENIQGEKI